MKMIELLEEDKEKLLRQLGNALTPEEARPVVQKELERILYRFGEGTSGEEVLSAASSMLETAKVMTALMDSIGDVEVWNRSKGDGSKDRRHPFRLPLLIAGIALAAGAFAVTLIGVPDLAKLVNAPLVLILLSGALALMYLAGSLGSGSMKGGAKPEQMTRCLVDGEKVYRSLRAVLMTVDRNLEEVASEAAFAQSAVRQAEAGSITPEELAVYAGLLEAAYSGDGEYALDKLMELKGYLHTKNIDVVEYTKEQQGWFDRMPSMKKGTLRPALVSDGKLVRKGLASAGL